MSVTDKADAATVIAHVDRVNGQSSTVRGQARARRFVFLFLWRTEGLTLASMGQKNFLIEGISGTGKTTVCDELLRRGYHALHGDRSLRPDVKDSNSEFRPAPRTSDSLEEAALRHNHAFWDEAKVLSQVNDCRMRWSFFCGGFRNHTELVQHFDGVFILEVDRQTLLRRLSNRPGDEFGGQRIEQMFILDLHKTKADMPKTGIVIDATAPIEKVVDNIVERCCRITAPD